MGSFVAAPRDSSERGEIKPEGLRDEDPGAWTVVAVLFLSSLYSSYSSYLFIKVFRFEGGCVSGNALLLIIHLEKGSLVPPCAHMTGPRSPGLGRRVSRTPSQILVPRHTPSLKTENVEADPQVGPPSILARVRASVPPRF